MFTVTMYKQSGEPYLRKIADYDQAVFAAEILTQFGDGDIITISDHEGKIVVRFIRDPRSGMWQKGF